MFRVRHFFNNKKDDVSLKELLPAKVVMNLDENGVATFQVEGRNKEILRLVGSLIADMAMYDKKSAEAMLTLVGIACELQINPNKTELKDKS